MTRKTELKVSFYNPNTIEVTSKYIMKICLEASNHKLESLLKDELHMNQSIQPTGL